MAVNLNKINWELLAKLRKTAKSLFDDGDYIGALAIQVLFLEGSLQFAIKFQLVKKGILLQNIPEFITKYQKIDHLINYFFLITQDQEFYEQLKYVNKNRNKIIHESLEFKNFDELQQTARTVYLKAIDIEGFLIEKYFEKRIEKKQKGITVDELRAQTDALLAQLSALQKQLPEELQHEIEKITKI